MHGYYANKHPYSPPYPPPLLLWQHSLGGVACTARGPFSSQNPYPLQLQVSYCPYSSVALEPLLSQAHLL